jgi:hypothetical protein
MLPDFVAVPPVAKEKGEPAAFIHKVHQPGLCTGGRNEAVPGLAEKAEVQPHVHLVARPVAVVAQEA